MKNSAQQKEEQAVTVQRGLKMAKKRERSSEEYLRGIVKQQRSLIKHLKKEAGRSTKRAHQYHDLEDRLSEEMIEQETQIEQEFVKEEKCPNCKGKLEVITLGPKTLVICKDCKYRKTR